MSKLAALAAKRRQKESVSSNSAADASAIPPNDYTASLKKLTIGESAIKEQRRREEAERQAAMQREQDETHKVQEAMRMDLDMNSSTKNDETVAQRLDRPSVFASTFLSISDQSDVNGHLDPRLLATHNTDFDFSKPSPDALVHKAQTGRNF